MSELTIDVTGVRVEPYAAVPTIVWSLHLRESTGATVHAISLRTQVRIEPQRRHYDGAERDRLLDMFGPASQWAESLRPFMWAHMDCALGGFSGEQVVEVPMAVTYDFEVAGAKYLHALGDDGEVPLVFFFSGTVFTKGDRGFAAELVPWNLEARYRLPVSVWRETMDRYFPGGGWLRLSAAKPSTGSSATETEQALPTWDQAIDALLKEAGEDA